MDFCRRRRQGKPTYISTYFRLILDFVYPIPMYVNFEFERNYDANLLVPPRSKSCIDTTIDIFFPERKKN